MDEDEIREALSRAVIGGLVTSWHTAGETWEQLYHVTTNDGRAHAFLPSEAVAFAAAVLAAEKRVNDASARWLFAAGETIYGRVGSTAIAFRITSMDRGELRAEAIRESAGG